MPNFDQSVLGFRVYEDKNDFLGAAEATMPDLNAMSQAFSGAGIAGSIDGIIPGFFEAMSLGLKFNSTTKSVIKLSEPRRHNLELRAVQLYEDSTAGVISNRQFKHVFIGIPKSTKGGTIAPAQVQEVNVELAIRYWATYIDGERVLEIDQLNYICFMNGVDYLEEHRKALGL